MARPSHLPSPGVSGNPEHAAVVAEVERIAKSPAFGGSGRQIRLLRFLVGEVLQGRGGALRAPVVATRVLGRPEGFDTTVDSIVRVEMSKLRRALYLHYASTGVGLVRIDLPRGSYAPAFVVAGEGPVSPRAPQSSELPSVHADGAVIAVLPFVGVTAVSMAALPVAGAPPEGPAPGARGRAFAHGLTDRLGTLFARAPGVLVVSRIPTLRDPLRDPLEDTLPPSARYVLEGSVRLVPGALRVAAKLHDTARGLQVWGNTYDRHGADDRLFAVEDEIADEMALELLGLPFGAVHGIEAQERCARPARSAYDVVLRFPAWLATFDPDLSAELERASEHVMEEDPDAWLMLVYSSMFHSLSGWTRRSSPEGRRRAADLARRAVAAEPSWTPHHALAFVLLDARDGPGAMAEAETALRMGGEPAISGLLIALAGDWQRGTAVLRDRMRALKRAPGVFHHALCLDAYRRRDYAAAMAEARAIATPHLAWDPLDRAVTLARLGRLDEARAAGRELVALLPGLARDPPAVVGRVTADEALTFDLVEALRLSGVG